MENSPDIVQNFYSDCQVVDISKDKSNLKGNCNKCKKTITGGWKPSCWQSSRADGYCEMQCGLATLDRDCNLRLAKVDEECFVWLFLKFLTSWVANKKQ